MKKRYEFLDFLRAAAILIVLNSHFDSLYPIPALATGGAIGNGLFFIISGFCLSIQSTFLQHMKRRFFRLYPGVAVAVTLEGILGFRVLSSPWQFFQDYLWPTAFWFIGALILFEAVIYWAEKWGYRKHFILFSAIMAGIYFVAYLLVVDRSRWSIEEPGLTNPAQCFKLIYCFYTYSLGYFIRKGNLVQKWAARRKAMLTAACALFFGSFGFKWILQKWPATMPLQFISQFFVILFSFAALMTVLLYEEEYVRHVGEACRRAVKWFASVSLEMYLLQFLMIDLCESMSFPVNVACVLVGVTALAALLHQADMFIYRKAVAKWS